MEKINEKEAAEFLKAIEEKKLRVFSPQEVKELAGRFQHFASKEDLNKYLAYNEEHKNELPF